VCKMFAAAGQFKSLGVYGSMDFHEFMTRLFEASAHDGQDQDAAGFFSWGGDRSTHARSSAESPADFIEDCRAWHSQSQSPHLLYIAHLRGAMSSAEEQINNHPFKGDNVTLMHEGWISQHQEMATKRGLSLESNTDSELFMRIADHRRPSLGSRDEWDAVNCMRAMLGLTSEPTALAFIDHGSKKPKIYFGKNGNRGNHKFHFYRVPQFKGIVLTSTHEMMTIASEMCSTTIEFEEIQQPEPFHVYCMDWERDTVLTYPPELK